jgi:hypothetical protein
MWKAILAGTTALTIAGGSLVYAQQRGNGADAGARWQPSQEDVAAFADARIAALKAGLRLTPEQEKNWPGFESALRDFAKSRHERMTSRPNEQRPADPVERLRRQADALSSAGATLKRLADAEEPLYKSLDDGQKHRFHALSRILGARKAHMAMRERGGGGWRGGNRPDGGQDGPGQRGPGGQRGRDGG